MFLLVSIVLAICNGLAFYYLISQTPISSLMSHFKLALPMVLLVF